MNYEFASQILKIAPSVVSQFNNVGFQFCGRDAMHRVSRCAGRRILSLFVIQKESLLYGFMVSLSFNLSLFVIQKESLLCGFMVSLSFNLSLFVIQKESLLCGFMVSLSFKRHYNL
jgi:hypothetical protein